MILAMLIMGRYEDPLLYGHVFAIIIVAFEPYRDMDFLPSPIKRIISILDAYSYCIYLIHPVVIAIIKNIFDEWYNNAEMRLEIVIVYFIGTAVLAGICHNVIEKPIGNIGRRKEQR